MQLTADFYQDKKKEADKEPLSGFELSNIFDLSDVEPAEIAIEDEIKRNYLWQKYAR